MKYYAVIDTNVLVSAMLNVHSNPGLFTVESLQGTVVPVLSDEILELLRRNLVQYASVKQRFAP